MSACILAELLNAPSCRFGNTRAHAGATSGNEQSSVTRRAHDRSKPCNISLPQPPSLTSSSLLLTFAAFLLSFFRILASYSWHECRFSVTLSKQRSQKGESGICQQTPRYSNMHTLSSCSLRTPRGAAASHLIKKGTRRFFIARHKCTKTLWLKLTMSGVNNFYGQKNTTNTAHHQTTDDSSCSAVGTQSAKFRGFSPWGDRKQANKRALLSICHGAPSTKNNGQQSHGGGLLTSRARTAAASSGNSGG